MLDIAYIRENADKVRAGAENKKKPADIDAVLALDEKRRKLIGESESVKAEQNRLSEEIAAASADDRQAKVAASKELKEKFKTLEEELRVATEMLNELLRAIPNVPSDDTPVGKDESENVVVREVGDKPVFNGFTPRDHMELGALLGGIDTDRSAKVSGSRFAYLMGQVAELQNALHQYVFALLTDESRLRDIIEKRGLRVLPKPFVPVVPPVMLTPETFERMARLEPREERYHLPTDDLYLVGSAEHTLGPIHMDETFNETDLPVRYFARTPAFRREAGSYGKDTKGIMRLHQFDKVEMESFCLPEFSTDEQELMVGIQEHIVSSLGIPYRVMQICTGDMGGPDSRQIDIECWMPAQDCYRETHTSDLMTDYQARRLNTRVRRQDGTAFVHMNDATAVADRMLIAILENFQRVDGSVAVPEALIPYMQNRTALLVPKTA